MPGYGPPPAPGQGPGEYQGSTSYDGFAIAGFVLSLVGGTLLAIIFGILGIRRTRGGRAKGRGLAIAAVVIGALWIVVLVVGAIFAVVNGVTQTYAVGDCVRMSVETEQLDGEDAPPMPEVACSTPHDGEVFAAKELPDGTYPGLDQVVAEAETYCADQFEGFVGVAYDDSELSLFYLYPQPTGWSLGDREITCVVTDDEPVTGTLRHAGR